MSILGLGSGFIMSSREKARNRGAAIHGGCVNNADGTQKEACCAGRGKPEEDTALRPLPKSYARAFHPYYTLAIQQHCESRLARISIRKCGRGEFEEVDARKDPATKERTFL